MNLLGKGSFGSVYVKDGIAIKRIPDIKEEGLSLLEPIIMSTIRHPTIQEAIKVVTKDDLIEIYQPLGINDLYNWYTLHKLSTEEIDKWGRDILTAIHILHTYSIIHCDVKSKNILLFPEGAKLCDFSLSIIATDITPAFTPCSGGHRAPEIWAGEPWSFGIDIWAYGCVLYEMMYREQLFYPREQGKEWVTKFLEDPNKYFQDGKKKILWGPSEQRGSVMNDIMFRCLVLPENRPKSSDLITWEIIMPAPVKKPHETVGFFPGFSKQLSLPTQHALIEKIHHQIMGFFSRKFDPETVFSLAFHMFVKMTWKYVEDPIFHAGYEKNNKLERLLMKKMGYKMVLWP